MEWGDPNSLPMETKYWVMWASRFHRWGVLPCSGSAEEQPYIFWVYVDLLVELEKRMREKEKYNREIKRMDFALEY